jgi:hypothetical protein
MSWRTARGRAVGPARRGGRRARLAPNRRPATAASLCSLRSRCQSPRSSAGAAAVPVRAVSGSGLSVAFAAHPRLPGTDAVKEASKGASPCIRIQQGRPATWNVRQAFMRRSPPASGESRKPIEGGKRWDAYSFDPATQGAKNRPRCRCSEDQSEACRVAELQPGRSQLRVSERRKEERASPIRYDPLGTEFIRGSELSRCAMSFTSHRSKATRSRHINAVVLGPLHKRSCLGQLAHWRR